MDTEVFSTMCADRGELYPLFIFADSCQVAIIPVSVITVVKGPRTNIGVAYCHKLEQPLN